METGDDEETLGDIARQAEEEEEEEEEQQLKEQDPECSNACC